MNLHFLLNISSDTENLYGVRFFSSFFQKNPNCNVTLFHICRLDCKETSHSLLEIWNTKEDNVNGTLNAEARKALNKAKRYLDSNEIVIDKVKTKTVKERYGKVKDILQEGSQGLYDAMILGRRASYALQWMFDRPGDEIPLALINDTALNCPLWICCDPEEGRKNVLLCVDESENSMRVADHVGFILSHAKHHKVTVFHVTSTSTNEQDGILQKASDILLSHGVEEERITQKSSWGLSVVNSIISEKNNGSYAAVAVGLHGASNGVLTRLGLQGKTTLALIKKISKAALWCCP